MERVRPSDCRTDRSSSVFLCSIAGYGMANFSGNIKLRWQPGTSALPPVWPGHIGYAVVPWKRGRGYATEALRQVLLVARERGLEHVDLTTDPDNVPSVRVILSNGGILIERFRTDAALRGEERARYRISLT